jgi:hypothetical protein
MFNIQYSIFIVQCSIFIAQFSMPDCKPQQRPERPCERSEAICDANSGCKLLGRLPAAWYPTHRLLLRSSQWPLRPQGGHAR